MNETALDEKNIELARELFKETYKGTDCSVNSRTENVFTLREVFQHDRTN
jgi:hypothetical protein